MARSDDSITPSYAKPQDDIEDLLTYAGTNPGNKKVRLWQKFLQSKGYDVATDGKMTADISDAIQHWLSEGKRVGHGRGYKRGGIVEIARRYGAP